MTTMPRARKRREPEADRAAVSLRLIDSFALACDGAPVALPMSVQRLVAFLALHSRPLLRSYVAGVLWPDTLEERAQANLRSALWRLRLCSRRLVDTQGQRLRLDEDVEVDLRVIARLARAVIDETAGEVPELSAMSFVGDLLPDWYDDWVLIEREHFRQLRLRALDALCDRLTRAHRFGEALEVGLASLVGEPLRESAHRAVIRVHLAEGNPGEAIRQYRLCRHLLGELGVEPSAQMAVLMREVTAVEMAR